MLPTTLLHCVRRIIVSLSNLNSKGHSCVYHGEQVSVKARYTAKDLLGNRIRRLISKHAPCINSHILHRSHH